MQVARCIRQLTVACALVLFASTAAAQSEWTIMIFMNGDNNLEPDALTNFRQLASVGGTADVNVIVQFDRIAKYTHAEGNWSQTLRFKITKGMHALPAEAVQDIGEANMGDPAVLRDFVTWARTTYPAKKYMLVIWDHGQGWRLFLSSMLQRNRSLQRSRAYVAGATLTMQQSNAALLRRTAGTAGTAGETAPFRSAPGDPYRSASNDETDNDVLYNREIHDALTAALNGQKLDVLAFDACLMSMVESAYAFRDVANYLVASEELEPGLGWPYDKWLSQITATPTATPEAVARTTVTAYKNFYSDTTQPYWDATTTMAAIDLTTIDALVAALDRVSDALAHELGPHLQQIIEARNEVSTLAPGYQFYHVDLHRVLTTLAAKPLDSVTVANINACQTALARTVLQSYAGADREGTYGASGLAIYYPKAESEYVGDPYAEGGYEKTNTLFPVAFVADHKWTDYLHAYWDKVP